MPYVITQNCCKDASCVPACPVDCIRPVGDSAGSPDTDMLYIDPEACIDCGACVEECPVDAIHYDEDLPAQQARFKEINAAYFAHHPLEPAAPVSSPSRRAVSAGPLRVAVVGAGPAACYTATELLAIDGVHVNMFERLPVPYGLIRAGVAPDHQNTKSVVRIFENALKSPRFGCYLDTEVGDILTHDDVMAHHHAVVYAVGAAASRDLGIPGEDLPGSQAAAHFVGWYNGHPDHSAHQFDLRGERAVIVGNGNVALDIARVLLMEPQALARTDIADHALQTLSDSSIREVVILGRRQLRDAAFSVGEFLALGYMPGVQVMVEGADLAARPGDGVDTSIKMAIATDYAGRPSEPADKRIVFRFGVAPAAVLGTDRVQGVQLVPTDSAGSGASCVLDTSLLLRSIGYRGVTPPGLHADATSGAVANDDGRAIDGDGRPLNGVYVSGWIKRGPRGVIGTNRACAQATVSRLWDDYQAGRLNSDIAPDGELDELLAQRGISPIDWAGWKAIDSVERDRGAAASRPRIKFTSLEQMRAVAQH
ncbi:4Fe-4S binding protein [Candidatus Mycobacterium wuenschmannii]|uniref:ferredoxin--NADP(+) reductase n=1 Tax=Candidatus Mycobacterium wuenschmannii TaxID=3027808 RepID=A0ABY8VWR3_9MYCO|nr:4Fe-4S binding protein [Candidatus Mycobacterium wuenschmannii]WIM88085.1 4Fe-4S binding protein [Candidatus Mycobacterium wuenschmannii]